MTNRKATKDDSKKAPLGLINPEFKAEMANVLGSGKGFYGIDNWLLDGGLDIDRLLDAVERHIDKCRSGEFIDPETKLSHLAHAATGCMMAFTLEKKYGATPRWGQIEMGKYSNETGTKNTPKPGVVVNPLVVSPHTGRKFMVGNGVMTAEGYRHVNPKKVWEFDPWTGNRRELDHIKDDPFGHRLEHNYD